MKNIIVLPIKRRDTPPVKGQGADIIQLRPHGTLTRKIRNARNYFPTRKAG